MRNENAGGRTVGQERPVQVHIAMADTEVAIKRAIDRKAGDHSAMKRAMATAMREVVKGNWSRASYTPTTSVSIPSWLGVSA